MARSAEAIEGEEILRGVLDQWKAAGDAHHPQQWRRISPRTRSSKGYARTALDARASPNITHPSPSAWRPRIKFSKPGDPPRISCCMRRLHLDEWANRKAQTTTPPAEAGGCLVQMRISERDGGGGRGNRGLQPANLVGAVGGRDHNTCVGRSIPRQVQARPCRQHRLLV